MNTDDAVTNLYRRPIDGWNARDADGMAAAVAPDGLVIGFDGSHMFGRAGRAPARRRRRGTTR